MEDGERHMWDLQIRNHATVVTDKGCEGVRKRSVEEKKTL